MLSELTERYVLKFTEAANKLEGVSGRTYYKEKRQKPITCTTLNEQFNDTDIKGLINFPETGQAFVLTFHVTPLKHKNPR